MSGFLIDDNSDKVLEELARVAPGIMETIGIQVEKYAKALCPVGTSESTGKQGYRGGTLRNSITHKVDDKTVEVGTNVEYAPYVELGTGPYFDTPPEWEHFETTTGSGLGSGYVHPRPYLRPAVADHLDEYKKIIEDSLTQ